MTNTVSKTTILPGIPEELEPKVRHFSVSSKWLYETDVRFNATTYAEEVYVALSTLEKCGYIKAPLSSLVGRVYHPTENQPRSNFKRIWVKEDQGEPFLTGKQLFFFRPDKEKYISRRMPKLHELQIPKGTILLSRSGITGFPVLVGEWLSQFAVTDDAIRVFPGSAPIGFIYAYLASSICRPLMVKSEYGATVSHIEAKHISTLPVPLIPKDAQLSIHQKILNAYKLRDDANALLDKAELDLHTLLGISPFTEDDIDYISGSDHPRAFSISSSEFTDRFDAMHHIPLARSAVRKLGEGGVPLVKLGSSVDRVYVAPRFARTYVESSFGTPLLQGSQLPLMSIRGLKYISNTQTEKMERWIIQKGWVLVTCSGTIGRTGIVTTKQDGWAASQHILRIMPRKNVTHPGFLATFLSTPFGQHQLNAKIYGGVVDELTAEDTANTWIPDIPYSQQEELGEPVVQAYELRDSATDIEEQAIADLESLLQRA
jgi:type I restriction enzyme S subunit